MNNQNNTFLTICLTIISLGVIVLIGLSSFQLFIMTETQKPSVKEETPMGGMGYNIFGTYATTSVIAVGTTSHTIATSTGAVYRRIQNNHSSNMYVCELRAVPCSSTAYTIILEPGAVYNWHSQDLYVAAITIISASGTGNITYAEK